MQKVWQITVALDEFSGVCVESFAQQAFEYEGHEELRALLYLTIGRVLVCEDDFLANADQNRLVYENG